MSAQDTKIAEEALFKFQSLSWSWKGLFNLFKHSMPYWLVLANAV
jgi:hypothetical protein